MLIFLGNKMFYHGLAFALVFSLFVGMVFAVSTPVVKDTDTNAPSGTYGVGDTIYINVNYNPSNIDVNIGSGSPTLLLNSGGTAEFVCGTQTPGSFVCSTVNPLINNKTLLFKYTIGTGEYASPLAIASVSALQLNGSTITLNGGSNHADNTIPPGELTFGVTIDVNTPSGPPTTTASGLSSSWTNTSQNLTLTCVSDPRTTCATTNYQIDGAGFLAYTTPVTISSDGNHQIDFYSTDAVGGIESTQTTYAAVDTTDPTITVPINITEEATSASGKVINYIVTVSDPTSGIADQNCSPASGSTFGIGATVVNCSATDNAGNTANDSFGVTVQDTTAPSLTVPSNITREATFATGAIVTYTTSATDTVDSSVTISCSPPSGSLFAIGLTTVSCSATDDYANTTDKNFNVIVQDTTAPTINPILDITKEATSASGAIATFSVTATDIVDSNVNVSCDETSGDTFPIGTTTVTCTATDDYANSSNETFDIIVQDTTPPGVTVPANITVEAGPSGTTIVNFSTSASDIVDGVLTTTCSPVSGSSFSLGTTTVNCSATDNASNTGNNSFTITVTDTNGPILSLPSNITEEATSPSGAVVTYSATASDIVDGALVPTCVPASGSTFALGTVTVNCDVNDSSNNNANGSFTITVEDTTAPIITLNGGNVTIEVHSPYTELGATATDVYDGNLDSSIVIDSSSVDTNTLGVYTVTYNVTDSSSNAAVEKTLTVTVVDTTAPVLSLVGSSPQTLEVKTSYVDLGATATDNYDGSLNSSVIVDDSNVNINLLGSYTVTYNVTDSSGNPATQITRTVNVVDTTAPVINSVTVTPTNVPRGDVFVIDANVVDNYDLNSVIAVVTSGIFSLTTSLTNTFGDLYSKTIDTNIDWNNGAYLVTVIAQDSSLNDSNVTKDMNVLKKYNIVVSVTPTTITSGNNFTVFGTLLTDDNAPVSNTKVTIVIPFIGSTDVNTDANGYFTQSFQSSTTGAHTVDAGYTDGYYDYNAQTNLVVNSPPTTPQTVYTGGVAGFPLPKQGSASSETKPADNNANIVVPEPEEDELEIEEVPAVAPEGPTGAFTASALNITPALLLSLLALVVLLLSTMRIRKQIRL